jgi:hypothetical protein
MLAELVAARLGLAGRGGIALCRQRLRQHLHTLVSRHCPHDRLQPRQQAGHLRAGEVGHCSLAHALGQEAQRAPGEVVIGVLESTAPRVGDGEQLGRSPSPALTARTHRTRFYHFVGEQRVEVPADGGGREPEPLAQRHGGDGPVLQDEPGDARTGAALAAWLDGRHGLHRSLTTPGSFRGELASRRHPFDSADRARFLF